MRDICPAIFTHDHTDPLEKLKVLGVKLALFSHPIVRIWWRLKQQSTVFRRGVIGTRWALERYPISTRTENS